LWQKKKDVGGVQLVAAEVPNANPKVLRSLVDQVRDKLKDKTVVLLGTASGEKVLLCLGLSKDLVGALDAGKLVKELAPLVEGTGGGKADFAQAGGTKAAGIPDAFRQLEDFLQSR
jgi:alanyl-tRNA synthetase